mgnify:CR=1 FL=1
MMYWILMYFGVGAIVNLMYECVLWWLRRRGELNHDGLNEYEKLLALVLWPIGLVVFLDGFFKEMRKK